MYVCVCSGVTERQVKAAITEGTSSLSELRKNLGVACQCGKCKDTAKQILAEHKQTNTPK